MKSVVIGTAGHIDHGKTSLVKALTGIDADRLEEEKRRGITIDLGFAHMTLPSAHGETLQIAFVDVPGHERFVRNMLAGAGGIDLALLVIAADESIMPQTREHLDILQLLGIKRGVTVLTKSDAVDAETLDVVRAEVEDFLHGTFLENGPIVAVSALTGNGMAELKNEIARITEKSLPRNADALARLPIDRVFTMKGFGTVVTGTLISGTIQVEDELTIHPSGAKARVRGLQVHGAAASKASAGQRTALNLTGVDKNELSRGMLLATAGALRSTKMADVLLTLLPGVKPLKRRMRAHFHAHTFEALADAVTLTTAKEAGAILARIKLPESTQLLPGDRFILRQESPVITIGGGVVLENHPPRKKSQAHIDALETQHDSAADLLRSRVISSCTSGLSLTEAVARTGFTREHIATLLRELPMLQQFGETLILNLAAESVQRGMLTLLEAFNKQNPLTQGMSREELRERMHGVTTHVFDGILSKLLAERSIETNREQLWIAGHHVAMKDDESESKQQIEQAFASAGLQVPALAEVLAGVKVDKARAQKLVTLLLRDQTLVRVSADLVFHRSALTDLRSKLAQRKTQSARIDVAAFKEITGVSRKYAIPLLEYLDRERVTRRVGDAREIL